MAQTNLNPDNSPNIPPNNKNSLQTHSLKIDGKKARYYACLSPTPTAPALHFYGGNGFAVGTYEPLLTQLAHTFAVSSLGMRGLWYDKPDLEQHKRLTREQDAKLLIQFLQKTQDEPVIGVGHSQGATATALACAQRPDLFKALVLLEPVTFTRLQKIQYDLIPRFIKHKKEPFVSTLNKQACWDSVQTYYDMLRMHRAYKRISDEHLYIFAKNSLCQQADGTYALRFPPMQELANYHGTPYITSALKRINKHNTHSKPNKSDQITSKNTHTQVTPYHIVLGKPSVFVSNKVRKSWEGVVATSDLTVLPDYGHLLPVEAPSVCAKIITKIAQDL